MSKPYHRNPRTISKKRLAQLTESLDKFGDLSGIVHNKRTDEIIGGNQRTRVFGEGKVEITHALEMPDAQGTLAHGFIVWHGNRFAYRLVDWDEDTAAQANVKANVNAGEWDWDTLASFDDGLLRSTFDADMLAALNRDALNVRELLGADNAETMQPPQFKEYDESVADGVTVCTCEVCGHKHARKD